MTEISGENRMWMAALGVHFVAATTGRCTAQVLSEFEIARSRKFLLSDDAKATAWMVGLDGDNFHEAVQRLADAGWPADSVKEAQRAFTAARKSLSQKNRIVADKPGSITVKAKRAACVICGGPLQPKTIRKAYCSTKCRSEAYRRKWQA